MSPMWITVQLDSLSPPVTPPPIGGIPGFPIPPGVGGGPIVPPGYPPGVGIPGFPGQDAGLLNRAAARTVRV